MHVAVIRDSYGPGGVEVFKTGRAESEDSAEGSSQSHRKLRVGTLAVID